MAIWGRNKRGAWEKVRVPILEAERGVSSLAGVPPGVVPALASSEICPWPV